ncbi:cyclic nucleotide-binding domain-containing protein [Simiduia curdlanivorans]|uniref:Cyclic nucleotide-binding domain-containing protein n=1 Tax=Simiduia curdlanivorans TaxID=1492769 RepID=A0ABV8V4Q2_9GAMM|nr:cyclic nucleotide-binding domain-containing protein [Simiduia curdlanivorans]MDN3640546.1 cyclic nucleotide-binding domain-containing protein [Simiduia curdlanivorans]
MTCYSAANFSRWFNDSGSQSQGDDYLERIVLPTAKLSALFGGVDAASISGLLHRCYLKVLRPGECVYRSGDLPDAVYLLISGRVRLSVATALSSTVKEDLGAGATFGDTALLGIQPHSDTATCLEMAEVLALSSHTFTELQTQNPALFTILLLNMSRDISRRLIQHDHLYREFTGHLAP